MNLYVGKSILHFFYYYLLLLLLLCCCQCFGSLKFTITFTNKKFERIMIWFRVQQHALAHAQQWYVGATFYYTHLHTYMYINNIHAGRRSNISYWPLACRGFAFSKRDCKPQLELILSSLNEWQKGSWWKNKKLKIQTQLLIADFVNKVYWHH